MFKTLPNYSTASDNFIVYLNINSNVMIDLHPQFIKDANGEKSLVVLSAKEFEALMEELDEIEDIRLYEEAKKGEQVFIDAETAFKEIEENRRKNVQA